MSDAENLIHLELDQWASAGKTASIWWRDDDAIQRTDKLSRLETLAKSYEMPVLLAIIPAHCDKSLAIAINSSSHFSASVHGYAHNDHSVIGQKKTELTARSPDRSQEDVFEELATSQRVINDLFGKEASQILVPPWNRIDEELASRLGELEFELLSGFTNKKLPIETRQLNCHLDIMQWKPEKRGKQVEVVLSEFLQCLSLARENSFEPIGILSHHLVHDDNAWKSCERLMALCQSHNAIQPFSVKQYLEDTLSS